LEGYSIDKDLIGRETAQGPIPKTLRPVFRDRDDFPAGHSLSDQTRAALEASQFLIAICSPNAARSEYVNEELRSFKAMGRAPNVIPVIVGGVPGDPEKECFPPAIRFKFDKAGALTSDREEPITADARQDGDGKEIAKQKVVAGLLGLGLDEIMRRAERARKRRNLFCICAAAGVLLVIGGGLVGWSWAVSYNKRLNSSQLLGMATDTAMSCQHTFEIINAELAKADGERVSEERQIALAVKCVNILSDGLGDMAGDARVPRSFIRSFAADVENLRKFADAGKLTSAQIDLLNNAETLVEQLKTFRGAVRRKAARKNLQSRVNGLCVLTGPRFLECFRNGINTAISILDAVGDIVGVFQFISLVESERLEAGRRARRDLRSCARSDRGECQQTE
jgi:hypothetical protein